MNVKLKFVIGILLLLLLLFLLPFLITNFITKYEFNIKNSIKVTKASIGGAHSTNKIMIINDIIKIHTIKNL